MLAPAQGAPHQTRPADPQHTVAVAAELASGLAAEPREKGVWQSLAYLFTVTGRIRA